MPSFMEELFYGPIEPTWIVDSGQFYRNTPYFTPTREEALARTQIVRRGTTRSEERCMRTVHFMVPVCCEKNERDLKKTLLECDDVESVTCDQWTKKVSVTSSIPPEKLLQRLQKFKARSTFWSDRSS